MTAKHGISPTIVGWDQPSLEEFDRRWLRGDTIAEMCRAFDLTPQWVCRIRRRRNLPTRRDQSGRYRGSRYGVKYVTSL